MRRPCLRAENPQALTERAADLVEQRGFLCVAAVRVTELARDLHERLAKLRAQRFLDVAKQRVDAGGREFAVLLGNALVDRVGDFAEELCKVGGRGIPENCETLDLLEEEVPLFEAARLIGSRDECQHRQKSFRFIREFDGHDRSQGVVFDIAAGAKST